MRTTRCCAALVLGVATLMVVGCSPSSKDMQLQAQQEEINRLKAEREGLIGQVAQLRSERDQAQGRALDLEQRLRELQARIGSGEGTRDGDWTNLPGISWTDISDEILFDSGKAIVKTQAQKKLQDVISHIQQNYPGREIWIVGHTDNDPIKKSGWKDNLELSLQRARAVFLELQKLGLDPKGMYAAGQGEFNPKVPNNSPENKAKNRRVQVIAVEIPDTTGGGG